MRPNYLSIISVMLLGVLAPMKAEAGFFEWLFAPTPAYAPENAEAIPIPPTNLKESAAVLGDIHEAVTILKIIVEGINEGKTIDLIPSWKISNELRTQLKDQLIDRAGTQLLTGLAFGIVENYLADKISEKYGIDVYQVKNAFNTSKNFATGNLPGQIVDSAVLIGQSFLETLDVAMNVLPPKDKLSPDELNDPYIKFMYALKAGGNAVAAYGNVFGTNNLMQNQLTAITQGGSSHIGSAALFTGQYKTSTPSIINPIFTASLKNQTAAEQGIFANSQAYTSSDWIMLSGDPAVHKMVGNSFGPITASNGGEITSLNNANVVSTHMVKEFYLPPGTKTVTLTLNGNFVTNEYPVFVGSQFNDYGVVKLVSPSGTTTQVTAFKEVLNSSNFQNVSGLPTPMYATGGQTGFKSSTVTIPVANGGKVIVDVQVHNVGDTAYPSAVLMNNIQLK